MNILCRSTRENKFTKKHDQHVLFENLLLYSYIENMYDGNSFICFLEKSW